MNEDRILRNGVTRRHNSLFSSRLDPFVMHAPAARSDKMGDTGPRFCFKASAMTEHQNLRTKMYATIFTFLVAGSLSAQLTQTELKQRRDRKLAKPVFQSNSWETNYPEALADAKREGRLVFAYFTRSYVP